MVKNAKFFFVLMISLMFSGCASVGYQVGNDFDEGFEFTIDEYDLPDENLNLNADDDVILKMINGETYSGRVLKIYPPGKKDFDFLLQLTSEVKKFSYDSIDKIQIVENPDLGKIIGTSVGLTINFTILSTFLLLLGHWLSGPITNDFL
jgi:hypothetical protein